MEQEKDLVKKASQLKASTSGKKWSLQRLRNWFQKLRSEKKAEAAMETVILEKTLIKLGGLLALGLGEAGIDVVGSNLSSERLDAMVPGRRMEAILGFVDIRGFNVVTEV